jgi:solute carrier family 6 amino acid transporter-like protein 5/7/9/14
MLLTGCVQVWRKAAGQVFFSLGISWGGIMMFGSYNKFNASVHIDAHIVSVVDFLTSILASIVIFATLGNSAYELGVPVETVAKGGQGLAFVAYPEALSHLPVPQFWSFFFFLMLFLLGLDSEFALFETFLCAVYDAFPKLRRHKVLVTSGLCLVCFLLGLPCITQGGQYVLDLMDTYGASISVLIIAVMELAFIMWGYGVNNVCKDIHAMLDFTPSIYFKVCWAFVSPIFLLVIFIASAANWVAPSYGSVQYPGRRRMDARGYLRFRSIGSKCCPPAPDWMHHIGWALTLVSVVQIPLWLVITTVAAAAQGDVWEAFRPSESWLERRQQGRDASKVTNISYLANQQPEPHCIKGTSTRSTMGGSTRLSTLRYDTIKVA